MLALLASLVEPPEGSHLIAVAIRIMAAVSASSSSGITLVNHPICPFGARAHIALAEHLGADGFVIKEASLSSKPAWFTEIYRKSLGADASSDGKVPVLDDGSVILTESAVVAEYVDRKYAAAPEARLLSDDPIKRAEAQLFANAFGGKAMGGFFKLMNTPPGDERTAAAEAYIKALESVSAGLAEHDARTRESGPFFDGTKFGWVELMMFPIIARRGALKIHRGFEIPKNDATARLWAWIDACSAHPAVVANTISDEWYGEAYAAMAARGDAKAATTV